MAARQNVQIAYVAAVATVFGALGLATSSATAQGPPGHGPFVAFWLAAFLPYLGLVFTMWFVHHDVNIGLLNAYLRACEECDKGRHHLPRWFTVRGGFAKLSDAQRWMILLAFGGLQLLAMLPLVFILSGVVPVPLLEVMRAIGYFSMFFGLSPVAMLFWKTHERSKIQGGANFFDGEGWVFKKSV